MRIGIAASALTNFKTLEAYMLKKGEVAPNASGRQELIENIINRYL
jgi:xylose isomerase